jgi:hypothetical protein
MDNLIPLGENICTSGGANGSDLMWGMCAGKLGHNVIHYSFNGHKSLAPIQEIVILTEEQLSAADEYCIKASKLLKRNYPTEAACKNKKTWYTRNLLRRNWYQVFPAERCYAVTNLGLPVNTIIPIGSYVNNIPDGGTAWAISMFINKHNQEPCECYLFDQDQCYWFKWDGVWTRIYEPPKPYGIYAGIGKRELNITGKLAIRILMDYKKPKCQIN